MAERAFRVGQRVRLLHSLAPGRAGMIATVQAGPVPLNDRDFCLEHWPSHRVGTPMYQIDLPNVIDGGAFGWGPGDWLEPVDDGAEKTEWTAELRKLCGVPVKERA